MKKCQRTPHRENPGKIVLSTPAKKKKLRAHATRDALRGSRQNLDDCVQTVFPCQPPYELLCERCAYEEI